MKAKLILLVLAAAAALGAWTVLSDDGAGGDGSDGVAREGQRSEEAVEEGDELEPATGAAGAGDVAAEPGQRRVAEAASAPDEAEPLPSWPEEETRWLEARIVLPAGAPGDQDVHALAHRNAGSREELFGGEGPFAMLAEGREPRRYPGALASARFGEDGSARLALPPDADEVWVSVGGTFVYTLEPRRVELGDEPAEITLRPALGAVVDGRVTGPDGEPVGGVEIGLARSINSAIQLGGAEAAPLERTVDTDPDGRFEFRAVPVGRPLRVHTNESALARFFTDDLEPEAGRRTTVPIELTAGGTVTGRVVDDAGEPVAGAEVAAAGREFFGNPTERLRETTSDEAGHFELPGLTPGDVWLRVSHDDFQAQLGDRFGLADGETLEVPDVVLDRGLSISGVVRFPDGGAAAGARVSLDADLGGNVAGSPVNPRAYLGAEEEATVDEDGAFQLTGLGEGPWVVLVELELDGSSETRKSGRWAAQESMVRAPSEDLALSLEPPVRLTGTVVDSAGAPVPAFTVVGERTGSQWYMPPSETRRQDFEDEDGAFALDGLRSGEWSFTVEAADMARSEEVKLTLPTEAPQDFVLMRPVALRGRVVDPGGAPVAGASIGKELEGTEAFEAMQGRGDWPTATSDDEGRFELGGLAPGNGSILAKKDGFAPSAAHAFELAEGESEDDVVLTMRRGGTISGEVYDAEGQPATGCMVIVQMPDLGERRMTNADSEGRFEEMSLTPGTWQVQAFPGITSLEPGEDGTMDQAALIKALKMTSVKLEDGAEEHVVLGAPPAEPVRVTGRVTLAEEPLEGMMVSFVRAGGEDALSGMRIETTDARGAFAVTLDEPGEYRVTVQTSGAPGMQNSVEMLRRIPKSDEHELDLEMPLGRISGRVLGPDREPVGGARVTLTMQSGQIFGTITGGQYDETRTDPDGRYEILFVRPGSYVVAAGGSYLGGILGGSTDLGRTVKSAKVADGAEVALDFELDEAGDLHGIVRDADGKPVADASIFVRDEQGRLLELFSFQATNASGRFEYDGLAAGEYTVTARTSSLASAAGAPVRIRSGETAEVTVTMDAGTVLIVSLTDKSGEDVRSRVSVIDERGVEMNGMLGLNELMERASGGGMDNEQRIGPLPDGRYEVRAFAEDGRTASRSVRLFGRDTRKLRLRLD